MGPVLRQKIGRTSLMIAGMFSVFLAPHRAAAVDILDDPIQIDERLTQLIQTSNSLCWEMHLYHKQHANFADAYRDAKQLWTLAGQVQVALRERPMETETLQRQTVEMNQTFAKVEKALSKWGQGDQSSVPTTSGPTFREVVAPGVGVDLPLLGIHVGRPKVFVTEDGAPLLERRRLHPNAHGSKRSLERELVAVKTALSYLTEDAGVSTDAQSPTPLPTSDAKPTPIPPKPLP